RRPSPAPGPPPPLPTGRSRPHWPRADRIGSRTFSAAVASVPIPTMEPPMKILMVLTSHADLGKTGEKTGFWLEEFSGPYYVFRDAGAEVVIASPHGGQPPLDPNKDADGAKNAA